MRSIRVAVAAIAILLPTFAFAARDAAQLQVALRKLNVLGSALYIAAHPDDENTAMLAWLANERGYRTGYLSVTRGDGGQNLIGDEKGDLLGMIRTQELLAARRIDGAEQYFTRAIDFGYSKTPEETLAIWNRELVLADVVRVIRQLQPDVIITRFPITGEGGHGHHTSSALLAEEAFTVAADPTKYPGLTPWAPKRIFWNRFSFRPVDPNDPALAKSLRVDLGTYNALLGRAYTEIAAESRSQHKSQGFGSAERRGTILNYFDLRFGAPATTDLFEGIDTSWSRYPGGATVGAILKQANDAFDPKAPQKSIPRLLDALDAMDRLGAMPEWQPSVNPWIAVKRQELLDLIRDCAGISIDVAAAESFVVPGTELPVSVTVVNRSDAPFTLSMVASPNANPSQAPGSKLENNKPVKVDLKIKVPDDAPVSQAYWLREPHASKGLYKVADAALIGRPINPPAIPLTVSIADDRMHTLIFTVPAVFRWTDPVAGEQTRPVEIVPEVVANLGAPVYLFPDAKPRPVTAWIRSFTADEAITARLVLPKGWKGEPASAPVKLTGKGDETTITFNVTPPASADEGQVAVQLDLANGKSITLGLTELDHPHIPAQRVIGDATAKVVRADVKKRGSRVGYIMGSGDDVPGALRQIGFDVELLTDADLDRGDFARFDSIVAGIRAYNTRKRLKLAHAKLMKYVENGGTFVVQYNTTDDLAVAAPGPKPFKISRDRVTVEEAAVTLLVPDHLLLTTPNKITAKDFEGWVQERGLYFTSDWDPAYTTILSSHDPSETDKPGGMLYTRHGKGTFIYTSYAWWRQLAAGVPGAYRMFANLVSAK